MTHAPIRSGREGHSEPQLESQLTAKTEVSSGIGEHPPYGYLKVYAELLERSPGAFRKFWDTELVSHVSLCTPCLLKVQRRVIWKWFSAAVSADEELSNKISDENLLRPRVADALSVLDRSVRRRAELSEHFQSPAGGAWPELESVATWFSGSPSEARAQLLFQLLVHLVSPQANPDRDEAYRLIRHRLREAAGQSPLEPASTSESESWARECVDGYAAHDLRKECAAYVRYARGKTTADELLTRLERIEPAGAIVAGRGIAKRTRAVRDHLEHFQAGTLAQRSSPLPSVATPDVANLLRKVNRALEALVKTETRMQSSGVPSSLSAEDLLQELANRARDEVSAYACSIYMRDDDAYVLQESTTLTPFLGRSVLDQTRDMNKPRCGITAWCATMGRSHLSPDVRRDEKWSSFGRTPPDISRREHCELPARELGSVLVVPINRSESPDADGASSSRVTSWPGPLGVLRVVRRTTDGAFTREDQHKLEELADEFRTTLTESQSFARLMDVGLTLNVSEMCKRASRVLAHLIQAKGVSIFLLDESKEKRQLTYRCRGTTGLQIRSASPRLLGPEEAVYELPRDASVQLTAYVAQHKRNVMIDDIYTYDFEGELGINRKRGPGKYGERFWGDPSKGSGPVMMAPLLFHERFDDFPAMGVLRASRPEGGPRFQPAEQRRFLALADRLAKAILRSRYHELLQDIALGQQPVEAIMAKVVSEVPKLLGGKGCSVFVGNPILEMAATSGSLEQKFAARAIAPYDVRNAKRRGITGAAVVRKETILYNSLEDRKALSCDGIEGSGRNLCEIRENPPKRLIVVPLLAGTECMGALRIPKTSSQARFSSEDVALLENIGRHLGVLLANARRLRKSDARDTDHDAREAQGRRTRPKSSRPRGRH
jgi:GAF domain-containing protein